LTLLDLSREFSQKLDDLRVTFARSVGEDTDPVVLLKAIALEPGRLLFGHEGVMGGGVAAEVLAQLVE
jgi:hypothetical protein